jgi:TctA family transporter
MGFEPVGNSTTLLRALGDPWLQRLLQGLGPVEQCTLMWLVLLFAAVWAARPVFKLLCMLLLGLLLGLVGPDGPSGLPRFTLDWTELGAGIDLAALALGLLGGADMVRRLQHKEDVPARYGAGLNLRHGWLYPTLLLICILGLYSLGQRSIGLWLLAASVLAGYALHTLDLAPAPLLLGFVMGPQMEDHLRLALAFSGGDWSVFFTRPLSAGMLACGLALVLLLPWLKRWCQRTFVRLRR